MQPLMVLDATDATTAAASSHEEGPVLADYVHLHSRSICRCSYSSDLFLQSLQISSLQLQQLNRLFAALVLAIYMAVDLRSPDLRNYVMIFSYDGSC